MMRIINIRLFFTSFSIFFGTNGARYIMSDGAKETISRLFLKSDT